ncbi:cation transporter [Aquabacter sp. CN5-332]|uniref:cation diffusion facilitator family transporter n=1 Tax=Aquabacter sp. CN5-332 TaxID=3156608 RepID=UPI0032B37A9E
MTPSADPPLDPAALARERSMLIGGLSDIVLVVLVFFAAVFGNSLMMLAETARAVLLISLEMLLLVLMRRIHRGRTHAFDYGAGKLEQFANAAVGTAMGLAGVSVAVAAAYRWWHPPEQQELGLVLATVFCAANVVQNGLVFRALWKAGRDGASVIMTGQVRTRLAKFISSGIVLVALAVNAFFNDTPLGHAAEVAGSAFVAFVMLQLSVSMWRQALPSLLDRTLEEHQQRLINRALTTHFEAYDSFLAVRSRLSGNTPYVEIELGFAAARTMGEVQGVADRVRREVAALIPGAVVTVTPVAE